jgi:glycosyltransferase involved in cell wall biosynthesis
MKPAIYYPWVYLRGGAERVLVELMQRSRHEWTLYTNHFDAQATFPEFADLRLVKLPEVSVRRTIPAVLGAGVRLLTQNLDLTGHESLLVVSEGLGNLLAARTVVPTSCICLTPLKVVYDTVTNERFFDGRRRPQYRAGFEIYRRLERPIWRRYRRVFCNSAEVQRRILEAGLVDPDRLEIVHHGVDLERFQPGGRREPYFLVAGRVMWQKNVELAIEAFRWFKPDPAQGPFRLVVAGMVDAKSRPYLEMLLRAAGGRPDIEFVESPADEELIRLYRHAHAVVFTAANEDWGLVVLEAMAAGRVVLATNRGGPRESVLDGVTGFLRPDLPGWFAVGMRTLAEMPAAELDAMGARGRERALGFSWDRFVDRMDEHVEELAAGRVVAPALT